MYDLSSCCLQAVLCLLKVFIGHQAYSVYKVRLCEAGLSGAHKMLM